MNGFFQLLIAWGVLLVFVLMLYMIDKLNFVFSGFSQTELPETYTDGLFGELYGKPLWDAMSGLPIPGIDKKLVENLKPHYEPVLRQHIEQVFLEGYNHAREGTLGVPSNNRMIPTPRGALESWLPLHHLTSIYEAGSEFFSKPDSDVMRIHQNLDQITSMLYARVGISLLDPYSRSLMIHPIGVERPHATNAAQSPDVPGVSNVSLSNTPSTPTSPVSSFDSVGSQQATSPQTESAAQPSLKPEVKTQAGVASQVPSAESTSAESTPAGDANATGINLEANEGLLLQPNLNNLNVDQTSTVKA